MDHALYCPFYSIPFYVCMYMYVLAPPARVIYKYARTYAGLHLEMCSMGGKKWTCDIRKEAKPRAVCIST